VSGPAKTVEERAEEETVRRRAEIRAERRLSPSAALRRYAYGAFKGMPRGGDVDEQRLSRAFAEEVHDTMEVVRCVLGTEQHDQDLVLQEAVDRMLFRLQGRAVVAMAYEDGDLELEGEATDAAH
jgi:hypothetical protein